MAFKVADICILFSQANPTRIAQSEHNVSPFATVEGVAN